MIGGEFAISLNENPKEYNNKITGDYYASGRTALFAILEAVKEIKGTEIITICVPDYLCGSVVNTIKDFGARIIFFTVGLDLLPSDDVYERTAGADVVLLVNYFGLTDLNPVISEIKKDNNSVTIVVDDVMNYYGFGECEGYDYSFTSLRKWFPVPDGSEIKCKQQDGIKKPSYAVNTFYKYKLAGNILKNYQDLVGIDVCLELLDKGEELLDRDYMASGSGYTEMVMGKIDKKDASLKRKRNATILHEGLIDLEIEHIYSKESIPLFIPIILKSSRDKMRSNFFNNNIFCPIHWLPTWQKDFPKLEINPLCEWELSLICDQRYGESEMIKQLETLKNAI